MKASGGTKRANSLASYGAIITLLASIALSVVPFSTPALADPPRPPVISDDTARQRDLKRHQAVASDQRRLAELERSARAARANAAWRDVQRETERLRQASLVAAARLALRPERGAAKPVTPPAASGVPISLQTCNDATPQEALAPMGALLIGKAWLAKSRGAAEALSRGITVQLSIGGVVISNAERFFSTPTALDHPVLGRVWITRWEYPLATPAPTPTAVSVRWTLEARLASLGLFNEDGTPLRFPADFTTTLACRLLPAAVVTGRITGAGVGLADGRVSAWEVTAGQIRDGAATDATGQFMLLLPPGSYRFHFDTSASPWLPEWWDDKPFFSQATIVTLAYGAAPVRLTPDLERGVFLSGMVTDAVSHVPVPDVGVTAQRADIQCCEAFFATTGAEGRYRMVVRRNITVKVGFNPPASDVPYLQQWWNSSATFQDATFLAIAMVDVGNINAALERGVFVRGRITDAETTLPLAGASVSASIFNACCENFFASANAQGEYAMAVRTNISLVIGFFPPSSAVAYLPSYWNGRRSFSEADPVVVGTHDVIDINGALDRGVFMRGRVTDAVTTAGVGGVTVFATTTACCEVFFGQTDADGFYIAAVRKDASLVVQFFPPFGSAIPYLTQWFHGRTSFATADPVVVTTVEVNGIDAALERGVFVRGHVTDAGSHQPIPLANISASTVGGPCCDNTFTTADTHGDYAVVVRKSVSVKVGFTGPFGGPIAYVPQWYNAKSTFDSADPITVGLTDVIAIDAALERGVFVRGRVTAADTNAGVAGAIVGAFLAEAGCCNAGTFASTDTRGNYQIVSRMNVGLKVQFFPPSGSLLVGEWYNAKATFDSADVVSVASSDVSGIDAALARGVFIRGRVTDAVSGGGLANVGVSAQRADVPCCEGFFASTDASGNYAMAVRGGISVLVNFTPPFGDPVAHLAEWWHDRRSFGDADTLPVGTTDMTGIDAALERGVYVRGHVTEAETGQDLSQANINVIVLDVPCCENYFGYTDSAGNYAVAVRPNINVKVSFFPPFGSDFLQEYYNNKPDFGSADVLPVGTTEVAGVNAALDRGVRLSGRVTDASGAGIGGVSVNVETEECCGFVTGTGTAFDGTYFVAVRPGRYKVAFYPSFGSDFLQEYYDNQPHSGVATVVVVGAVPVTGINATLERAVLLSGRVTDASGAGVPDVGVSTSPVDPPNAFVGFDLTDADGYYEIPSRSGDYKVGFFPPFGSELLFEFYDNRFDFVSADVVHIGSAPVPNIDAVLETTRPAPLTIVDARITANVGTTDFAEVGDAFTATFSAAMDLNSTADAIGIQDQDGTRVTLRCGVVPNRVACQWDAASTMVTVTVDLAVPFTLDDFGTTPGLQIPFNIVTLAGFSDVDGNVPSILGSSDRLVDYEAAPPVFLSFTVSGSLISVTFSEPVCRPVANPVFPGPLRDWQVDNVSAATTDPVQSDSIPLCNTAKDNGLTTAVLQLQNPMPNGSFVETTLLSGANIVDAANNTASAPQSRQATATAP